MNISQKSLLILGFFLLITSKGIDSKKKHKMGKMDSLFDVLKQAKNIYERIKDVQEKVSTLKEIGNLVTEIAIATLIGDDEEEDTQLQDMSSKLDKIMTRMDSKFGIIEKMLDDVPLSIDVDRIKGEIAAILRRIWDLHRDSTMHSMQISKYNHIELGYFVEAITGLDNNGLRKSLTQLYGYIVPSAAIGLKKSFLDLMNDQVQAKGERICSRPQSTSQYLYHLYKDVVTAEMMGQVALGFGFSLQKQLYNVSIEFILEQEQQESQRRLIGYFSKFKAAITQASNIQRPCDPLKLIRDVTFIEMEKLAQKVLANDYYLYVGDRCSLSCDDIDVNGYENDLSEYVCTRLHSCKSIGDASYCLLENNSRRYQWIKDAKGNTYGEGGSCRGTERSKAEWMYWARTCRVCACTCEIGDPIEAKATDRLDTRPVMSDISENKVITGIKFTRCNPREVSIIIKQGILLPSGVIDEISESWKECNDSSRLTPDDSQPKYVRMSRSANYLHLNDVVRLDNPNAVVVGIRFFTSNINDKTHTSLALQFVNFNIDNGTIEGQPEWIIPDIKNGRKVNFPNADSPLARSSGSSVPHPTNGNYIQFESSSLEGDAGQTTIPLFDGQIVDNHPPAPLNGIGIFWKSIQDGGGYLGFRVHTLNHGKLMRENN